MFKYVVLLDTGERIAVYSDTLHQLGDWIQLGRSGLKAVVLVRGTLIKIEPRIELTGTAAKTPIKPAAEFGGYSVSDKRSLALMGTAGWGPMSKEEIRNALNAARAYLNMPPMESMITSYDAKGHPVYPRFSGWDRAHQAYCTDPNTGKTYRWIEDGVNSHFEEYTPKP